MSKYAFQQSFRFCNLKKKERERELEVEVVYRKEIDSGGMIQETKARKRRERKI